MTTLETDAGKAALASNAIRREAPKPASSTQTSMSLLNSIFGQVSGNVTVENLAAKVGMSPDQVETAVTALGQAHGAEGL